MAALILDVRALTDLCASAADVAAAHDAVMRAGRHIQQGAIVVFATETFYGLAARPQDAGAILRLARLKGRDKDKPIALIASDNRALQNAADMPQALRPVATAFWPGPLTLLLPPLISLAHPITVQSATGPCVGVRISSHPVARALSHAAGGLITATSANLSGAPAVCTVGALDPVVSAGADVILDAGPAFGGLASTVAGVGPSGLFIVRQGAISAAALEARFALGQFDG